MIRKNQKKYLSFSDKTWKKYFENDVQYFNRIQASNWLKMFKENGFILETKIVERTNIDLLDIDKKYSEYEKEDLECTVLTIVHRKPK